jgi:enoyl-CoA hydratase/carnithine racemase
MSLADESPHVLESREGGILTLTLNRGSRFNPLSRAMIDALDAALVAAAADSRVRVIVLAGAGRGFSAGHDLKEMRAHAGDAAWQRELFGRCNSMMQRIPGLPVPVIARVHGIATAAGCQLVSMCDLAVAADTATFALPGVNIGVFCSTPAVGVARNVARKHVMEMLLTGDAITAAEAASRGLVNRAVPPDQLDATVQHYAARIAARSRKVIGLGKQTFYAQSGQSLESAYELAGAAMACNLGYEDAIEGMDAFLGKRAPEWHDR